MSSIHAGIDSDLLDRWREALVTRGEAGLSQQSWLRAAPPNILPGKLSNCLMVARYCTNLPSIAIWAPRLMLRCGVMHGAW